MRATTGFVDLRRGIRKLIVTARMTTRKKTPIRRATYARVTHAWQAGGPGSLPWPRLNPQERQLRGRPQAIRRGVRVRVAHPTGPVRVVESHHVALFRQRDLQ